MPDSVWCADKRDVVRHDSDDVDDVLEVTPESKFRRTGDETQHHL